jgi:hypothetical protein
MIDKQPNPPRLAQVLLKTLLKPTDSESISGDLLEEYGEVRRPSLGRIRADAWYAKHVLSFLWRLMWPCAAAVIALRILSFPLPSGWNPSLLPAPGVSLLDALIYMWAGFYGAQRTRQFSTGAVTAGATGLLGFMVFLAVAAINTPSLLLAPFEKPFIFAILFVLLLLAFGFGIAFGMFGAVVGRRFPKRKARLA